MDNDFSNINPEFLSKVSHDIRGPLGTAQSFVDLLIEGDVGELSKEQLDYLSRVKRQMDVLMKFTSDTFDSKKD